MIIQTVSEYEFTEAFRAIRPDNFSYNGLKALFAWFEDYSDDSGEPFELDVIAICCELTEYTDLAEVQETYPELESLDDLRDNTIVIEFDGSLYSDGGIIIQDY